MKRITRKVSALMCVMMVFVLAGCSNVDKTPQKPEARGFIWSATKDNYEVKLVGTMHPSPISHKLLTNDVVKVLEDTDVLSVEVDMTKEDNVKKVQKSLYLTSGETIEKYLSEEELSRLKEIAKENKIDYASIKSYNASGLSQIFDSIVMLKSGYTGANLDTLMIDWAKRNSVELNELEGIDFQLGVFDKLYTWEGVKSSIDAYSDENNDVAVKNVKQLFDDYINGDEISAIKLVEEIKNTSPEMYDVLIYNRNIGMTEKVEELVKDNKKHTIAVGYRHFIGEDSILKMLEEKGYTITRVN